MHFFVYLIPFFILGFFIGYKTSYKIQLAFLVIPWGGYWFQYYYRYFNLNDMFLVFLLMILTVFSVSVLLGNGTFFAAYYFRHKNSSK